jgi:subtilisin family serine protease
MGLPTDRRLHPRLRMVANGSDLINAHRSQISNCVASVAQIAPAPGAAPAAAAASPAVAAAAPAAAQPAAASTTNSYALESLKQSSAGIFSSAEVQLPAPLPQARPKLPVAGAADQAFVNVFIETIQSDPDQANSAQEVAREIEAILKGAAGGKDVPRTVIPRRNFVSATVPVSELSRIAALKQVTFVHPSEPLALKVPSPGHADKDLKPTKREVVIDGIQATGEGVLIGIIDIGGFDFAHEDFLDDNGETRFEAIWDQGGRFRKPPADFDYGAEFTGKHLNDAIKAAPRVKLPAIEIERQSQRSVGSHGTHVASIAAGRSGVCPRARIAGVLVSIPEPATELAARQWNFSDSSRIVHAVEYLYGLAKELGLAAISINISLGTNGGSHDGANGPCRWLDSSLSVPGRAITMAAGNAGQEAAQGPGDLGWMMGRIHTGGQVQSRGLDVDLEWVVVGDGYADFSENELEIWYSPQDRLTVSVQPPGSAEWFTVGPRQYIENRQLANGSILSMYSELFHPTNGDNYVAIYLSPNLDPGTPAPISAGVWKIRLHGDEIRDGRFHAWIERDDPMELGRLGSLRAYRFPSFFSKGSHVDSHSIGSLACAHRIIAVANIDAVGGRVSVTSSQGPTRDGRFKPDIAAPGTDIVAANGFDRGQAWTDMSGTSMASPYVCGVIGLMLSRKPNLNAAQCQGILKRTARPLPSHGYEWRNDAGYGTIDPVAAVREADVFDQRVGL